ncbi:MAG: hypothetical protein WC614_07105 [bacterium]
MRNNNCENLMCRIEKVEKKLYRYIEAHADLFTQTVEIRDDLEEVKTELKALKQELQAFTNHIKEWNSRGKNSK